MTLTGLVANLIAVELGLMPLVALAAEFALIAGAVLAVAGALGLVAYAQQMLQPIDQLPVSKERGALTVGRGAIETVGALLPMGAGLFGPSAIMDMIRGAREMYMSPSAGSGGANYVSQTNPYHTTRQEIPKEQRV